MKNTKIVCTIGPASEDRAMLEAMVSSGMNVARLNFSHGTYDNHRGLMASIRTVSKKLHTPVAIMQDLQGPKIRIGELAAPFEVKAGQVVSIGKDFAMDFDISGSVKPGNRVLIEDGLIELRVERVSGKVIRCRAQNGGTVQSHKGVNIPDSKVTFPIITKKDIQDLKFGLENDVDFVAVSFVRSAKDIRNVKSLIAKYNPKGNEEPLVIAKIEKPEAITDFDEILAATDGVMVARGDLGVEVADRKVPIIQKEIIAKCIRVGKPVIVATQMLDSMIRNPRPTRAEVSDVANAVIDGTDATMLSGESAFGKYPLNSVREMAGAITAVEQSPYVRRRIQSSIDRKQGEEAVSESVHDMANRVEAKAIVGAVSSFQAAMQISKTRTHVPILMYASSPKLFRQLSLVWGAKPVAHKKFKNLTSLTKDALKAVRTTGLAKVGDEIVVVASEPGDRVFRIIEVEKVK